MKFWLSGAKPGALRSRVDVEGDVGDFELPGRIGGHGAVESADRVGEMHGGAGDDCAGGVGDCAVNRAGVAALRSGDGDGGSKKAARESMRKKIAAKKSTWRKPPIVD